MNLANYYYYFQSALPPRLCDDIIKYGTAHKTETAITGGVERDDGTSRKADGSLKKSVLNNIQKKRKSDIVWLNDRWIYKEIHPYIHQANKAAGWNFQWDWSESCQFTKYKKGQYYDWHCDSWDKVYSRENDPTNGKIRKLSVTVSLSDPKEYKGGELEFDFRNTDPDKKRNVLKCKEILPKGSLVVFPSFVWHRVCPVKSGERKSLVIWNLGWPFK